MVNDVSTLLRCLFSLFSLVAVSVVKARHIFQSTIHEDPKARIAERYQDLCRRKVELATKGSLTEEVSRVMNDIDAYLEGRGVLERRRKKKRVVEPDEPSSQNFDCELPSFQSSRKMVVKSFGQMKLEMKVKKDRQKQLRVCRERLSVNGACVEYGTTENESRNLNLEFASALRPFDRDGSIL
ncbi:hypothetical protein VNO78_16588 [Psophocarpus tetragonolobus]|uniref:Uncharacterized protein n=1 Tax=Psophocarpus tetragonolobus TaxID=3891 RepID=A0AAN9XKV2_PSOTE